MVVPEAPNERPEVPNQQGAEAQAVNKAQQDVQSNPVSSNDLNSVFSGRDDSSALLGKLAFSDDKTSKPVDDQLTRMASERERLTTMTTGELEDAISMQRSYVNSIENQIGAVTKDADAQGLKKDADKLATAIAYSDSGLT